MLKTIWMSDLHFAHDGLVQGHDPQARLQAAIDHTNAHHADARFCVISGDMVNRESAANYAALRDRLATLTIPVLPMVGNHDDRNILRDTLSVPDTCMAEFIQYTAPTDSGLIVCVDTQKTGSDAGEFCRERRAWLDNVLGEAGDTPVLIFMHHPPMPLGLPMQDADRMEDGDAFLDLLSMYENVKHLFIGHVHRPITGTVRGIPFATMRSVLYQAPAPQPEWNWDTFKPSEEAPSLGIITIANGSVILQFDQFCAFETGVTSLYRR